MSKGGNCKPLTWKDQDYVASTLQQYCKCHEIFPRKSHDVFKLRNHWTNSHPHMCHIYMYVYTYIYNHISYIYIYIFIDAHLFLQVTTKEWRAPQEAKHVRPRATLQLPSQAVPATKNRRDQWPNQAPRGWLVIQNAFGINWTPRNPGAKPTRYGWWNLRRWRRSPDPALCHTALANCLARKSSVLPRYMEPCSKKTHWFGWFGWFGWVFF